MAKDQNLDHFLIMKNILTILTIYKLSDKKDKTKMIDEPIPAKVKQEGNKILFEVPFIYQNILANA